MATASDDQAWTRADCARWFVHHDEVDEAARVLEPGDELELGPSDALSLAAALSRRGLPAQVERGRVLVLRPELEGLGDSLAAAPRKPPARAALPPDDPARAQRKRA